MFINTPSVYKQISSNPFPKFPISQKTPAHLAWHYLGNWEMGNGLRYRFPNFPKDPSPSGLALFGKLGNGYRYILPNFPISQKTPAQMGQHYLGNWEMIAGTYFPISQKTPAQMGQHDLENWEIGKWLEVQISQFPNFPKDLSPSGSALFGKLGNDCRYRFPNFPKDPSPDGPARFGKLGNGHRHTLPNFPISQKTLAQMGQHDLENWEIGKLLEVQISQFPNFPNNPSPDGPALFGKLGKWEA